MKYIDLTLGTPAENLACDEALLNMCEEGLEGEILRFWEPKETFVVVGYANQAAREANLEACRAGNVPVLRRCSGGGTVLQGLGCLNYSLADVKAALRNIWSSNEVFAIVPTDKIHEMVRDKYSTEAWNLKF